ESMSQVPFYDVSARWGAKFGHQRLVDGLLTDGLTDVYSNQAMGSCAELCAEKYEITRSDQDHFAMESYKRSRLAWDHGKFDQEITAVRVKAKRADVIVNVDEEVQLANFERMVQLKPSFKTSGTITAANSSTISD